MTDSTTMGLGVVYGGLRLEPGDEVLTTEHDFYSTHEALRLAAGSHAVRPCGEWRSTTTRPPPTRTRSSARLLEGVTPVDQGDRDHVDALEHRREAPGRAPSPTRSTAGDAEPPLLCVDAVHALGVEAEALPDLGCDVLVAGTHKWLFGPRGTGIVWANERAWAAMDPGDPAVRGRQLPGLDRRRRPDAHRRWHAASRPAATTPSSTAGRSPTPSGSTSTSASRPSTSAPTAQATQLKAGLAEIAALRVVTPTDPTPQQRDRVRGDARGAVRAARAAAGARASAPASRPTARATSASVRASRPPPNRSTPSSTRSRSSSDSAGPTPRWEPADRGPRWPSPTRLPDHGSVASRQLVIVEPSAALSDASHQPLGVHLLTLGGEVHVVRGRADRTPVTLE